MSATAFQRMRREAEAKAKASQEIKEADNKKTPRKKKESE